jgi:uncharacterized protein YdhG (YjbR/CyaY superfamily)
MKPTTIDDYIKQYEPKVQAILRKVRAAVKKSAPKATEKISYGMPTLVLDGHLIYFGAFAKHIGLFPPVREPALKKLAAKYAGPKGNLKFPYDEPIPYGLIGRIVKQRVKENKERKSHGAAERRRKKVAAKRT